MNFHAYVRIDAFEGIEVYELLEIDRPFRNLIGREAVDVEVYRRMLERDLERNAVPLSPRNISPFIPVSFSYERPGEEQQRTTAGIVVSESHPALVRFARESLRAVDNPVLEPVVSGDERELDGKLFHLLDECRADKMKYRSGPLVPISRMRPRRDRRRNGINNGEANLFFSDGDRRLLVPTKTAVHRTAVSPEWHRPAEVDGFSARGSGRYSPPDYSPRYQVATGGTANGSATGEVTTGYVFPVYRHGGIIGFFWEFGGDRGRARTVDQLPVRLCENLDASGCQVPRPEGHSLPVTMTFLRPTWVLGAEAEALRELRNETFDAVPESGEASLPDALPNGERFVVNMQQPIYRSHLRESGSGNGNGSGGGNSPSDEPVAPSGCRTPISVRPAYLAYLLQRTRDLVYEPDAAAEPFDGITGREGTVWFGISPLRFVAGGLDSGGRR